MEGAVQRINAVRMSAGPVRPLPDSSALRGRAVVTGVAVDDVCVHTDLGRHPPVGKLAGEDPCAVRRGKFDHRVVSRLLPFLFASLAEEVLLQALLLGVPVPLLEFL